MNRKIIKLMRFIEEELNLEVCELTDGEYIADGPDYVIEIRDFNIPTEKGEGK